MTQLVIGVAAAAAFGPLGFGLVSGGAAFVAGTTAAGMLGIGSPNVKGPRLSDLNAPKAAFGSVLPWLEGTNRVAGVYAWQSTKREKKTRTSAGKGGPTSTSYSYEVDVLIVLGANECAGVRKVYKNGKLVYSIAEDDTDSTVNASLAGRKLWSEIIFYSGAADQLPDPTYEAALGVGNCPAYRGRASVFIRGLKLGNSDQLPLLTFEVSRSGAYGVVDDQDVTGNLSALSDGGRVFTFTPTSSSFAAAWFRPASAYTGRKYIEYVVSGPQGPGYHFGCIARDYWSGLPNRYAANPYGGASGWYAICNGVSFGMVVGIITNGAASAGLFGFTVGDVIGVLIDHDSLLMTITKNGGAWWSVALASGRGGYDPFFTCYGASTTFGVEIRARSSEWAYSQASDVGSYVGSRFTPGTEYLDAAISRQCIDRAGLTAADIDVTALAAIPYRGFAVTQLSPPRGTLEMLELAYGLQSFESGGKIKWSVRGSASVETIPFDDLGATEGEPGEPLPLVRANDLELPGYVQVTYANALDDYQDGTVKSDRILSSGNSPEAIELALVLSPAEAQRVADMRALDIAARTLRVSGLSVTNYYAALEPCDVITVLDQDGSSLRLRINKITDDVVRRFDADIEDLSIVTVAAITDESQVPQGTVTPVADTVLQLIDSPIFRDSDDAPGLYAAVTKTPIDGEWSGAVLFQGQSDAGYVERAEYTDRTFIGTATTVLGDFTGIGFDEVNRPTVSGLGALESYTEAMVLNGTAPYLMFGAEAIYYQTATLVSAGVYTLSRLLRGRRGTEQEKAGHIIGDAVTLMSPEGVRRITLTTAQIGVSLDYRAVTEGFSLDESTLESFTSMNLGGRPFAPVHLELDSPTSPANLTWTRRTRLACRYGGAAGVLAPLGEATESYIVEVTDASDVVLSTQTVSTNTAAVTFAATNKLKVSQVSAIYGRGNTASITV